MMEKPQELTLEQKIKSCKEVIIQNMEKTLQHKMVYLFLSNKKIDSDIKTFSLNSKDGVIKIEFHDAEKAKRFYDEYNFREKILLRPFNIYFNLQLSEGEMKKYFIEGLTEDNQRTIFDAARRIGICKLYTNYLGASALRKLKPKGVLSFIRKDELTAEEFKQLQQDLLKEEVKISPYVSDKGLKCSINISNFYTGDSKNEDYEIMKEAETEIKNLVKNFIKDQFNVSTNVKKKDDKVSVTALLEFTDNEQAMNNFELLRENFLNKGDTKAVLFFHNHENNSYFSLYTSGLGKTNEDQSEKQFENELLQTLKKVNKDVLQVNVYPVKFNNTYVGRIYLRSEEAGKNFIVDYVTRREELCKFFRDKNRITFNINVDTKTLKKIKQVERKATEIARTIKNS